MGDKPNASPDFLALKGIKSESEKYNVTYKKKNYLRFNEGLAETDFSFVRIKC